MADLYEVKLEAWLSSESESPGFSLTGRWPDRETLVRLLMGAVTEILAHGPEGMGDWTDADDAQHPEMRRYREGWRHSYGTESLLIGGELVNPL